MSNVLKITNVLKELFICVNNLEEQLDRAVLNPVILQDLVFLNIDGFAVEFFIDKINIVKVEPDADEDVFNRICGYVSNVVTPTNSDVDFGSLCANFKFNPLGTLVTPKVMKEFVNEVNRKDIGTFHPAYVRVLKSSKALKAFFMKKGVVVVSWSLGYRGRKKEVTLQVLETHGNSPFTITVSI